MRPLLYSFDASDCQLVVPGWARTAVVACLLGAVALVSACDGNPELPMSPTTLDRGVVLYEHANFQGNSGHLTADITDLRDFTGPCVHDDGNGNMTKDWNDCISSIRVAEGWRATLYRGTDFKDDALETDADVPNLQLVSGDCDHDGMNDCVTSVRVRQR